MSVWVGECECMCVWVSVWVSVCMISVLGCVCDPCKH